METELLNSGFSYNFYSPIYKEQGLGSVQQCRFAEGVPWERWILRNFSKMRVHARPSFIVTINLPSFVTLIRCFIGRSKPLGRLEEFGQAVFHKEVKIQRSPGTPSPRWRPGRTPRRWARSSFPCCRRRRRPAWRRRRAGCRGASQAPCRANLFRPLRAVFDHLDTTYGAAGG